MLDKKSGIHFSEKLKSKCMFLPFLDIIAYDDINVNNNYIIKFERTMKKALKTASLYRECELEFLKIWEPSKFDREDLWHLQDKAELYIELLIVYLRILPDCIAQVLPSLFGTKKGTIPNTSFTKQLNFFNKKRNRELFNSYATLLDDYSDWYYLLADKKNGLRNQMIHDEIMSQKMYVGSKNNVRFRIMYYKFIKDSDDSRFKSECAATIASKYFKGFLNYLDELTKYALNNCEILNKQVTEFIQISDQYRHSSWLIN